MKRADSGRVYQLLDMTEAEAEARENSGKESDRKELVGGAGDKRNWRGIAIALLVIIIVCALIITAIILATPGKNEVNMGLPFTMEDYFNESFKHRQVSASWIPGEDKLLYRNEEDALLEYSCGSNSTSIIMDNSTFRMLDTRSYSVSSDRLYVLLKHDSEQVYRHTTLAHYSVYDVNSRGQTMLKGPTGDTKLQYAAWGPVGNTVVFVQNNNIYYQDSHSSAPEALTSDGAKDEIYNGVPDWVYEEEILSTDHALWVSPNGSYLCYASFNDSQVPRYIFPVYGLMGDAYGQLKSLPYPKPGFPNPTFKLKVVRLTDQHKFTLTLEVPKILQGQDHYFTSVVWRDNESMLVNWMNRAQNMTLITLCHATNGTCRESIRELSHGAWVDSPVPLVSEDGSRYFVLLPERDEDAGYFDHVAMVEIMTPPQVDQKRFLTIAKWSVTEIVGFDSKQNLVYFIGTKGDPRKRHLFKVDFDGKMTCLTCGLDPARCDYVSASFSSTGHFYLLSCLGPGVPYFSLRSASGHEVLLLENNTEFAELLAQKAMPRSEYVQIDIEGREKMWGKMLLPPVLKEEEITEYPLLLTVYGGPGSQKVTDQFSMGWETYLSSSLKYIVAYADGRGSGGRGHTWLHRLYRKLGTVEVEDAIAAGNYFKTLHYVDGKSMGVWGWSYGGYVTASVLNRGTETFRCGMSVAPVTDWIYYDSVYTERYMGMPADNLGGYQRANVTSNVDNFKKSKFLLIHGTGDDNVHFQHSAQLMKALEEADVYYRLQVYTDKHHGLLGTNTRRHFYATMEDFLHECFLGSSQKFGKPVEVEKPKEEVSPKDT